MSIASPYRNHPNTDGHTVVANTRSAAEQLKQDSRFLRGRILDELATPADAFAGETVQILKFHGVYQQNDRDARKAGGPAAPGSMVRVGVPGGVLTAGQYLALDRLADEAGDGSLRLTTRQDVQFHRVRKADLRALLRALNENLLTTLAACGDVVRNVVCCPAPFADPWREELQRHAQAVSRRFKPTTSAYSEVWLEGATAAATVPERGQVEPVYGATYLPRKFKIAFAVPGDNCVDAYANDIGIVPVCGAGGLEGFTLLVGGGLGFSPGVKASRARLAEPLGTVIPAGLGDAIEAIVSIHRDFGNRADRRLARLKYVVQEWGLERFRAELERVLGRPLAPPVPLSWTDECDHLGWHVGAGGTWFLGIRVLSGRIRDTRDVRLRGAIRTIVERFEPEVRLTPRQNLLLAGIRTEDREEITFTLRSSGVALVEDLPPVFRHSMACPALPTCGLAITEAERVLPGVLGDIHRELERAGLGRLPVSVSLTGCSNGCARPLTAEIGLVGQSVNRYGIYLGGSRSGTRLAFPAASNVPREDIGGRLRPIFALYGAERLEGEAFGDFCHRAGAERLTPEVAWKS